MTDITITMGQFLSNPTGKSSANVARRDRIKADLTARFHKLYKERKKGFSVTFFKLKRDKKIVGHIKVPSEELNKTSMHYDVLIEYSYPESARDLPNSVNFDSLKYMAIKVFSNSPNFTFTYAYVFNQADLLIDWMKERLSRQSLEEEPVKRNPDMGFGFEKSIYFAMLYLQEYSRQTSKLYMNDWSKDKIKSMVPTANQKLRENKQTKDEMKKRGVSKQNITRLNPFSTLLSSPDTPKRGSQKSAKKNISSSGSRSKSPLGTSKRKPLVSRLSRKKSTRR